MHTGVYGYEVGQPAPNCKLAALSEQSAATELEQHRGKVLYVDFWASWCGPCAQSFPFMNALQREFGDQGLQILAINVDEKADDAKAFLAKHPASFGLAADASGQCPKSFGVKGMPTSYLVDKQGVIRHIHLGFRAGEAEKVRDIVGKLLSENGSPLSSSTE
jgi:thiol-disulfide isomerase/thioredoxin